MRIWSIHPRYLDWKGLGALWRETLLAQRVLLGGTRGWRNHPQRDRFKGHAEPLKAVDFYRLRFTGRATGGATGSTSPRFWSLWTPRSR